MPVNVMIVDIKSEFKERIKNKRRSAKQHALKLRLKRREQIARASSEEREQKML